MQALCSAVVWYDPEVSCGNIGGYDVRLYDAQLVTQNTTRRVGANGTFYIIQDEDKLADEQELYVQVDLMSLVNQNLNIPCTYYRFDSFTETDYV